MGVVLNKTEKQEFLAAAAEGDRSAILRILDRFPDVFVEDENHFTPLMHAAAGGHGELVQILLPHYIAHEEATWLVQQAFEAAAEEHHAAIARLLIDIGADPDWAFVGMQDYWERCPICLARCCPGARKVCAHWVCSSDTMGFTWFLSEAENFEAEVEELVSLAVEFFQAENLEEMLMSCPKRFREVLVRIRRHGRYYWAMSEGVYVNRWETKGTPTDSGFHFYATDPRHPVCVREKALAVIAWLYRNLP
jgi:hypothetical protein